MNVKQKASTILTDDYILVGGRKVKIPSPYGIELIGKYAGRIEIDYNKLTEDGEGVKYALALMTKYTRELVNITGVILYGRTFLARNIFTRPFSNVYRRFKTRQLMHDLTQEQILNIFIDYVRNIGIENFTNTTRFIAMMTTTASKDELVEKTTM